MSVIDAFTRAPGVHLSFFSVVVPAYNAEDTLAGTLEALVGQTFDDWECVIVDDGSTDGTRAVADSAAAADQRLTVITQDNRGTGAAYNTGVRVASGEWVTVCSADDVLLPRHLSCMRDAIAAGPDSDILSCNGYYWGPDGSRRLVYRGAAGRTARSWTLEETFERCFFSVGACYRYSLFDLLGGYREDVYGEDYDFWLRAMAAGARHRYVPEALSLHRVSATQKSADRVRAYESDIRSISAVLEVTDLTESQVLAARAAIRHRRRLISELEHPGSIATRARRFIRPLVVRLRGR
jgi:glycosyltransferase involved in cell wall biosynthesis